jgi:DNA-directed RNA polymerase sigma subunit (sigma70/sigma32)
MDLLELQNNPSRQGRSLAMVSQAHNTEWEVLSPKTSSNADSSVSSTTSEVSSGFDATRIYLKEIGHTPLLTAEEEVSFGRLVQQGDSASRHRMIESDLSPIFRTMTTMRFPVNLTGWRSRYEEAVHRRTNH